MSYGLKSSGISVVAGVDKDPACEYAFETNVGAKFIKADVAKLDSDELASLYSTSAIKILAGGPPCQPFSSYSQGRRRDSDDWSLLREFGRLVTEIEPDLVIVENVRFLAGHPIYHEFTSLLSQYSVDFEVLNAADYGVPQGRKRLVLVASRLSGISLKSMMTVETPVTVRQAIGALAPIAAGEVDEVDPIHRSSRLSDLNLRRIRESKPGGSWKDWPEELRATCHVRQSGSTYPSVYGRMEWDEVSPTITTQAFGYGNGRFGHPDQDRAISLREAAILQSFPAEFDFIEEGGAVKFSELGRLIGNAVPVKLAEAIGDMLLKHVQEVSPVRV